MTVKKPTLQQVATLAQVSSSAASMILNNRPGVSFSPEAVERVRQAAQRVGYVTRADRAMEQQPLGSRTIFVFAPNVISPYYSVLLQSIEQSARARGYDTLIYNTYRDIENEKRVIALVEQCGAAGAIFAMMPKHTLLVEQMSHALPVVVVGDRDNALNVDTVETSNYTAGVLLAEHLIGLGHQHIAFLSTTLDQSNTARTKRRDGMQDTFARLCPRGSMTVRFHSITPQQELDNCMLEHSEGFALALEAMEDKRVTALVGVNDMVAYGIVDAVLSRGFTVPGDYSVAGFDNNFPSGFTPVSLTSVEHCIEDKGHNAFDILYSKMLGGGTPEGGRNFITRVEYRQHLVPRGSTAPPPTNGGGAAAKHNDEE